MDTLCTVPCSRAINLAKNPFNSHYTPGGASRQHAHTRQPHNDSTRSPNPSKGAGTRWAEGGVRI